MTVVERLTIPTPLSRVVGAYEGDRAGPTMIVVGGVHGNEPGGIVAAQRTLERLESERPSSFRGRLVALAGHLGALGLGDPTIRYLERDLNRMCSREGVERARGLDASARSAEERELVELIDAIEREVGSARGGVVVLDLHSVSSESPPFVFVEDSLPARRLARSFEVPIVLGFEEELRGLLVDYCTNELGVVSALVEGGLHDRPETAEALELSVRLGLDHAGMWPLEREERGAVRRRIERWGGGGGRVYDVRHRHEIVCDTFKISSGMRALDRVRRARTVIAEDCDGPVRAAINGLLFMPNRQPRALPGDDGFFIVRRVGWVWLWISARARSSGLAHWALATVAPGVRCRPGSATELVVDPNLAMALKREVFHLLGYRIVRRGVDRSMGKRRRVVTALGALARALALGLTGRGARGEPGAGEWVVSRHRLDVARRSG